MKVCIIRKSKLQQHLGSCPRNEGKMSRRIRWIKVEQTETGGHAAWEADNSVSDLNPLDAPSMIYLAGSWRNWFYNTRTALCSK